jgi:hypothetical protein
MGALARRADEALAEDLKEISAQAWNQAHWAVAALAVDSGR